MTSDDWIKLADRSPALGQQVVLADESSFCSDELGCVKDVGVLKHHGDCYYWAIQGYHRSRPIDAFTHWIAIEDPSKDSTNHRRTT